MTAPTRVAVIGCGAVSSVHFAALRDLDGVQLVGVCDVDPTRAEAVAVRHDVPAFTDHRQLLESVQPDAVHVCTPHDRHADVAVDCIVRGVHTVLEKPIARTVAEAQQVLEASLANPATKVAICFQNRYNQVSQEVHRLITDGAMGQVRGAAATVTWTRAPAYYNDTPWRGQRRRSGGGVLINQAIHTVDLLVWFLGPVVSVTSRIGTLVFADIVDVEDTASLVMTHASGARSVLFATLANTLDSPVTIEIDGSDAHAWIRGDATITRPDGSSEVIRERLAATAGRSYWGASHELLIRDFYRTLADPDPFWIGPAEGIAPLAVLDQVYGDTLSPG